MKKQKMRRVNIWLYEDDYKNLRRIAFERETTISALVREGIRLLWGEEKRV
ncbi:MAG: hypothetical protein HY376_01895 [Candidatus Blackburnbacteria bacterium]|nr:hypothetical protein [Candidatus Blackburnbacteria bacterium]